MLARVILTDPDLIICDSIFTGLTRLEREAMANVILSQKKNNETRAFLFLTSDPSTPSLIPAATRVQLSPEHPS
jgi:ABC-type molybdenum transport system ATPase subunit/photorepair protein PhrA